MPRYLEIRHTETEAVEHRIDVTGKSESDIAKVEMGLLRKLDHSRFFVVDTGEESPNAAD